jgi:hypothetical protein
VALIHVAVLVLTCTSLQSGRGAFMPLVAQVDAQTVLEGTLEVLIEDADHDSRTLYFLTSGDQRVQLLFPQPPLNFMTGERVRVRGRWDKNHTLVVTAIERI